MAAGRGAHDRRLKAADVVAHATPGGVCLAVRTGRSAASDSLTFVPDTGWAARGAMTSRAVGDGGWTRIRLLIADSLVGPRMRVRGLLTGLSPAAGGPAQAVELDVVADSAARAC